MSAIEATVVEATAAEVAQIPPSRIPREMERAGREQPELLSFVLGCTEGMSPGVSELAGFIYFVIWRVFRDNSSGKLKMVTAGGVQRKLEENEKALERLDATDAESITDATVAGLTTQPALFNYALLAITEAQEDETEAMNLSPEETGHLVLIFKTVIDTLDEAREREGN